MDKNTGILLCNLGTPDAPTASAVRRYLAEFLRDPRVVAIPKLVWYPILYGIVLRTRPKKVAKLYEKIWTEEGSPLLAISKQQARSLKEDLARQYNTDISVEVGMTYGTPSIKSGLAKLVEQGVERVVVLPMYPQYCTATTESVFDRIKWARKELPDNIAIDCINNYHDHPGYISALTDSIKKHWAERGKQDKLLFSFHGVPQRLTRQGDPYESQCRKTADLVVRALELDDNEWEISFQSRFGKEEWLKPYTDQLLTQWAKDGVKSVDVISPGFSADCLETLEEIAILNREIFLEQGGREYRYIAALNAHTDFLKDIIEKNLLNS